MSSAYYRPPAACWDGDTGEPENLTAAAADALEWLRFFDQHGAIKRTLPTSAPRGMQDDAEERLRGCIAALQSQLFGDPSKD